ncbi:MAG: DUF4062 domain-containing protein [Candidatus Eisenbacteria bacterium]|nr:DUF4062 domain-containing protein [Candidatus Eisenbacteria bacterium]
MKTKVFLSSTAHDLTDLRAEVAEHLRRSGFEVLHHESPEFPKPAGLHSHDVCLAAVKDCDVYVLVVGRRYGGTYAGSAHPKKDISITWYESEIAFASGKLVLAFVRDTVWNERPAYKRHLAEGVEYHPVHVDDVRVFEFVEWLVKRRHDNWLDTFRDSVELRAQLRARLRAKGAVMSVLFYGQLALSVDSFVEIKVWRRRPSALHRPYRLLWPNPREDCDALLIQDADGNAYYSDELSVMYIDDDDRSSSPRYFRRVIRGQVGKLVRGEHYTMLELVVDSQTRGEVQDTAGRPELGHASFFAAQKAFSADRDTKILTAARFEIARARGDAGDSLSPELADFLERILEELTFSKAEWADPEALEDSFETSRDLMRLAKAIGKTPLATRRPLAEVIISFLPDGRRALGGTVGGWAERACAAMADWVDDEQMRRLIRTFEAWLESEDAEALSDAVDGIWAFRNRLDPAERETLTRRIRNHVLTLPAWMISKPLVDAYLGLAGNDGVDDEVRRRLADEEIAMRLRNTLGIRAD